MGEASCCQRDRKADCLSIEKGLSEVNKILGSLYRSAFQLLLSYSPEIVDARIVLSHACCSMRDLMNDIPESFPGDNPVPRRSGDERSEINLLMDAARDAGISGCRSADESADVAVPYRLVAVLQRFLDYEGGATQTADARMRAAVSSPNAKGALSFSAWKSAHKFFQSHVHVRSTGGELPSRAEVLANLDSVNNVLTAKLGKFFAAKSKIKEILTKANEQVGGEYVAPSDGEVLNAIACFGDINMRFVFYTGLNNPQWIAPLSCRGVFASTSASSVDGYYSQWPEGMYLSRMAALAQDSVSEAFDSMEAWDSPYVLEAAIVSASVMEPVCPMPIMGKIAEVAKEGKFLGLHLWHDEALREAIVKALKGSKADKRVAVDVIRQCLMPRGENCAMYWNEPSSCMPSYGYRDFISSLVPSIDDRSLYGLIEELLEAYSEACGLGGDLDSLSWRIGAIGDELVGSEHNPMLGSLIFAMHFALSRRVVEKPESFRRSLTAEGGVLIRRVAIYSLYAELSRELDEGRSVDDRLAGLVKLALVPDIVFDDAYDPELLPLLRVCVDCGVSIDPLWEVFSHDLDVYESAIRAELIKSEMSEAEVEGEVEQRSIARKHKVLSLIGEDRLPESMVSCLADLEAVRGKVEYSERHVASASWVGPVSPISLDEMRDFGALRLIRHLKSWHPDPDGGFSAPSHSGQGDVLAVLIRENPSALDGVSLTGLRPEYCKSILMGWKGALEDGLTIPFGQALGLCEYVSLGALPDGFAQEGSDYDDDASFASAAHYASGLLREVASRAKAGEIEVGQVDLILGILTRIGNLYPVDCASEQERLDAGTDALTLAINTVHSAALESVFKWLDFCSADQAATALDFIASRFPIGSGSISDAVVIAKNIAVIIKRWPDWLDAHLDDLFGGDNPTAAQKAALSSCLSVYRPSRAISSYLSKKMLTALRIDAGCYPKGFAVQGGGEVEVLIGIWVMMGVLYGYLDIAGIELETWDGEASAESKRKALKCICNTVGVSGEMPDGIKRNFMNLYAHYEAQVASAGAFYIDPISNHWLMKSGQFETTWWVEKYLTSERRHPDHNAIRMSQDEIVALADEDPISAMELMMLGLRDANKGDGSFVWLAGDMAPRLLHKALASSNAAVIDKAKKVEDELGFMGFPDLDDRISEFSDPSPGKAEGA